MALRPISVVVVGVSGMLSEIVREILDQPDIRVVAELPADADFLAKAGEASADVLILLAADQAIRATVGALLTRQPRAKVLTIRDDGRTTSLYELRPFETALGQVSPVTLLDAVRTAAAAR
jgi:hypothetical protein